RAFHFGECGADAAGRARSIVAEPRFLAVQDLQTHRARHGHVPRRGLQYIESGCLRDAEHHAEFESVRGDQLAGEQPAHNPVRVETALLTFAGATREHRPGSGGSRAARRLSSRPTLTVTATRAD